MEQKFLLSIAIPTYNRSVFLQNLLNNIVPQIINLNGLVQICISNNCSTDNTEQIIMDFSQKYPGLIKYYKQEKNFGAHVNFWKVLEISDGNFVWLLGDDDEVAPEGIKKVINGILHHCNQDTGLIVVACESYFIDEKTGKKTIYSNTIQENKPKVYVMDRKDIIGQSFPAAVFISILLFNNHFLKKILQEEKELVDQAIKAKEYIHTFLYRLMFLKYKNLQALYFNEVLIYDEAHLYKFYVEDVFQLHHVTWMKLCDILLSSKYINDNDKNIIINDKKRTTKMVIMEMAMMKCFKSFNYTSFLGCIKIFFKEAPLNLALLFSAFFIIFSIIPGFILRNLYKFFVIIKHKENWKKIWLYVVVKNYKMSRGSRRLIPPYSQ